jgi:hypothetical protein
LEAKGVQEVNIADIVVDDALYPRVQFAWQTAYGYSEAMKTGVVFPPIALGKYRKKLYLVDGLHRLNAFKKLKRLTVSATIKSYGNREDMFVDAVRFNSNFGKPLTFEDKAKIYGTLKSYSIGDSEIEKLIHVPVDKFNTLASRQQSISNGKFATLPTVIAKAVENEQISEVDAYKIVNSTPRKDLMSKSALTALTSVIVLFENNLVPLNNSKVDDACVKLNQLLQARLSKVEVANA